MNDVRFTYVETQRERKGMANGARCKKGHRGPKKCTMPSDYMTRKEKEQLNGELTTWDMTKPYPWDDFKKMPDDIKIEYINRIINKYDVGLRAIAEHILYVDYKTVYSHLVNHNLRQYLNMHRGNRKKTSENDIKKFLEDFKEAPEIEEPDPATVSVSIPPTVMTTEESCLAPLDDRPLHSIRQCSFELSEFDINLFQWIASQFKDRTVKITLNIAEMEA